MTRGLCRLSFNLRIHYTWKGLSNCDYLNHMFRYLLYRCIDPQLIDPDAESTRLHTNLSPLRNLRDTMQRQCTTRSPTASPFIDV